MKVRPFLTVLVAASFIAVPFLVVIQSAANAAGARKAEWRTPKAGAKTAPAPTPPATSEAPLPAPPVEAPIQDQSQEVLDNDMALAASIASQGPKIGYSRALSEEGVLYDANGASPKGQEAATTRFATFPAEVSFVRTPEKAVAAGGSGSSWGTYTIKRGDTILSTGRYISVWRREASGWKMISELAAGRNIAPAPAAGGPPPIGALPKRPAQLGRATPAPVGVPLTVPTPPAAPANTTPPSTP